ncbi:hypothetical protein ABFT51_07555 [Paenibacillus peoriae]|uniref:hypothetical protein n=1 Tax=Paenibacillus peoriae TaxID=59893 RepID=UPI0032AF81C9
MLERDKSVIQHYRLNHPGIEHPYAVMIDLKDDEATGSLLVYFDFERNGWSINRWTKPSFHLIEEYRVYEGYREVAFVPLVELKEGY